MGHDPHAQSSRYLGMQLYLVPVVGQMLFEHLFCSHVDLLASVGFGSRTIWPIANTPRSQSQIRIEPSRSYAAACFAKLGTGEVRVVGIPHSFPDRCDTVGYRARVR